MTTTTTPPPSERCPVVREILETERSFVASLRTAVAVFWRQNTGAAEKDADPLVALVSELRSVEHFNGALLGELEEAGSGDGARVGRIFREYAPYLKRFATYLRLYEGWTYDPEDPRVRAFEEDPRCQGQSLGSFLIMPVQRVPRYRLLLEELAKRTPAGHADFADLEVALALVKEAAGHNNATAILNPCYETLTKIQLECYDPTGRFSLLDWPGRRLELGPTQMTKLCRKGPKQFTFWLFTDKIVYARRVVSSMSFSSSSSSKSTSSPTKTPSSSSSSSYSLASSSSYSSLASSSSSTTQSPPPLLKYHVSRELPLETVLLRETAFATVSHRSIQRATTLLRSPSAPFVPRERGRCFEVLSPQKSFVLEAPDLACAKLWRDAVDHLKPFAETRAALGGPTTTTTQVFAPIWTPDVAVKNCEGCERPFGPLSGRRRHHCRSCGLCFCHDCTAFTKLLPHVNAARPLRVCAACHDTPHAQSLSSGSRSLGGLALAAARPLALAAARPLALAAVLPLAGTTPDDDDDDDDSEKDDDDDSPDRPPSRPPPPPPLLDEEETPPSAIVAEASPLAEASPRDAPPTPPRPSPNSGRRPNFDSQPFNPFMKPPPRRRRKDAPSATAFGDDDAATAPEEVESTPPPVLPSRTVAPEMQCLDVPTSTAAAPQWRPPVRHAPEPPPQWRPPTRPAPEPLPAAGETTPEARPLSIVQQRLQAFARAGLSSPHLSAARQSPVRVSSDPGSR
eukprot:CAMPEP_0118900562 /NCGR_PEP_ID=MMETSP1166-20130328/6626_1 /TAXON_ID=1104430 /ORGANISM="Chrysoreinhardia sp, Strain CCMP3193" /LENGTH=738 /DNA_ID=CAMNT_0006839709 /DNA_START=48 /DNA_END=2264 /DNA_ORIENTATION=+